MNIRIEYMGAEEAPESNNCCHTSNPVLCGMDTFESLFGFLGKLTAAVPLSERQLEICKEQREYCL
jgi:hypothetical protein